MILQVGYSTRWVTGIASQPLRFAPDTGDAILLASHLEDDLWREKIGRWQGGGHGRVDGMLKTPLSDMKPKSLLILVTLIFFWAYYTWIMTKSFLEVGRVFDAATKSNITTRNLLFSSNAHLDSCKISVIWNSKHQYQVIQSDLWKDHLPPKTGHQQN